MSILGKLRYTIEGDDSQLRKTLKKLKDDEAAQMRNAMKQVTDITETEKRKRKEVIAVVNQETQAIKKRNQEEANRPKRKPIISDSAAEIAAYNTGQTGTIASGTVVGQSAEYNKLANAATAASAAQEKVAVSTTKAAKAATAHELNTQRLALRLESYKNIANTTFDPKIREQYNKKIQETTAQISRMSNVGKEGFDALGNKIKGSGNLIGKLFGGVRQLAYILPGIGIAGLFSLALGPLFELIAGLDIFNGKMSQTAQNLLNYNEVNKNAARTAGEQIATLKILYSTATDVSIADDKRKKAALELQKVFPDSFANSKTQAILNGQEKTTYDDLTASIIKNSRARAAKDKIDEIEAQRLELDDQRRKVNNANANENRRARDIETFNEVTGDVQVTKAARVREINNKRAKEALDQIAKEDKALLERENFLIKFVGKENIAKALETETGQKRLATENQYQAALSKRQDILNNLQSINNEINRNDLTADEQGRQAIKDRFADLRTQLIKYNTWALNYNKTAKKDQKVGLIPLAAVDPAEDKALGQYDAKLAVDKAKQQAEQMKQVYAQYEDYRTQYGEIKAKQRYHNEINGYENYVDFVKGNINDLEGKRDVSSNMLMDFYTKELPSAQKEASERQFNNQLDILNRALDSTKTLNSERERMDREYAESYKAIQEDITITDKDQRLAALKEVYDKQIEGLRQMAFEASEAGKAMSFDLFNSTQKEIQTQIEKVRAILKTTDLTPEQRKSLQGFLSNLKQSNVEADEFYRTAGKIADGANQIASALSQLGDAIGGGTGYTIGQLSNLVGIAGNTAGAAASFMSGDIIGGASKAIGAVTGLLSMGKKVKEMNAAARAEVKKFYDEALNGEKRYQAMLRDREIETVKRGKTSYQSMIAQLEAIKKQSPEVKKAYEQIFNSLQGEEFIQDVGYKHGTWLRKAKTWDIMATLAGSDYARLEQLYTEGRLKDQAKADFEALKQLREELEQAGLNVQDLQNQIAEMLTGTSIEGLSDMFAGLIESGEYASKKVGDTFKNIVGKSILNTFKYSVIEKAMAPVFEQLTKLTEGGRIPNADEVQAFVASATAVGEQLGGQWKAIADGLKAAGLDMFGEDTSALTSNTIKASLTEDTAGRALGIWNGMYDINKRMLTSITEGNGIMAKHMDVSMQGLRHWAGIEVNTANTVIRLDTVVTRLDSAVTELKGINKNTSGLSSRDRGV